MKDQICEHCKSPITEQQRKSGFYPGGSAYAFGKDYIAGPSHAKCSTLFTAAKAAGGKMVKGVIVFDDESPVTGNNKN